MQAIPDTRCNTRPRELSWRTRLLPRRSLVFLPAVWLLFGLSPTASAETGNIIVFEPSFFVEAQAKNAYDMVQLLPGFTFDPGDDDVRGYSGASGNVLIGAQRPAAKFDSLKSILERIPVAAIQRIELIRGTHTGIDMQGQMLVANIVRRRAAATEIGATVALYAHGDSRRLPEARLDVTRQWNEQLFEASVEAYKLADDDSGTGFRQRSDASDEITRDATSRLVADDVGLQATLGFEQPVAGGQLRLNAAVLSGTKSDDEQLRSTLPVSESAEIQERKNYDQLEFGARFVRPIFDDNTLELLAIQQLHQEVAAEVESTIDGDTAFREDTESGESILRGTVRNPLSASSTFEWGAELAYNFLDSRFGSEDGGTPLLLPEADVSVREYRAEGFANVSWENGNSLQADAGLAYEFSRISQQSDSYSTRELNYLKPRVSVTWTPSASDQVRIRLQRLVGQLDFGDFVSSAELSTDTVNIGNPDLEPETSWDLSANWERRLRQDATLVFGVRHSRIDNVVDLVPIYADTDNDGIDEVFEGPGNLGSGTVNELSLGLNLPLSKVGIAGGTIKGDITWRDTAVNDPTTGQRRQIAGKTQHWEGRLEFSQDIPAFRLRWGAHLILAEQEPEFRLDETRLETEAAWVGLFANIAATPNWRFSIELQNLSSRNKTLTRTLFDAPRDSGEIVAIDTQSRTYEPYVVLQVQWQSDW